MATTETTQATMRAVRVHEWGVPPRVDDVAVPVIEDGESLVKVEAAAVAHLDLTVSSGSFDLSPELPYVGGVEGCGVVVLSDVYAAGTRVALRGGGLGVVRDGSWAELVKAPTKTLTPLPDGLTAELGATFFAPATTAQAVLKDVARLGHWSMEEVGGERDEVVVVAGAAGAVGSMVVQLALRAGCTVIGLVGNEAQRALVAEGAEAVMSADVERLTELTAQRPATLLVDTLGGPDLMTRAHWVRAGGRAVVVGYVAGTDIEVFLPNWLLDDVALIPTNMMRRGAGARKYGPALAQMLVDGELHLEVETFALEDAGRALELLANGGLRGRAVLVPSSSAPLAPRQG